MSTWKIQQIGKKPKLRNPIFIEGLPGIGNVGKVAIDFLIDELKSVKIYEITSYTFPHSVFVNEDNLVELPKIEIFYKKFNNKKYYLLLMSGDVQPVDEVSSYEFSDKTLDIVGVSGLLLGLAEQRKIDAISFLAETYGHPMYLGIKGAREILNVLNKKLNLKVDTEKLDKEIKDVEAEIIKKTRQLSEVSRTAALKKLKGRLGKEM